MMTGQENNKTQLEQAQRESNFWMLFAVVSSLVVIGLVAVVIYYALNTQNVSRSSQGIPYNILDRNLPITNTAGQISLNQTFPQNLARRVGENVEPLFQRAESKGNVNNFEILYILLANQNSGTITVRGARMISAVSAQALVEQLINREGRASEKQEVRTDTTSYSYYLDVDPTRARFVYSHQEWYFDIQAPNKEILDTFMEVFPY
jgi:hypothetical protein